MQETNKVYDRLINDFAENYMEKLFYFCLKKTGSPIEAEDLTQDISLQVITSLSKGSMPASFSAWVWKIARNRYSVWAKEKHIRKESVTGSDVGDYEIEDESGDILDKMINAEQTALLRRELAFIKSDYRNIVVAYYIDNKNVREIAESLSLSTNTVKSRLFRAREVLKEGMNMAREFGKLSYNPQNVDFINNGCLGANGEPWNYISRLLCKNIFLATYKAPSTAEELAMELGVALPYMEEELSALSEATLLKKNGNRYETNFFIVSAEAQEKIYAHLRDIAPRLTTAVIEALEFETEWKNKNTPEWHEGYQAYEDMKWALLMAETDTLNYYVLKVHNNDTKNNPNVGTWGHTIRPNGGEWDILGMEKYCGDHPDFVGLNGCVSNPRERDLPEIMFRQYRFKYRGLEKNIPLISYADGQGILNAANGKSSEVDSSVLKRLEKYGYVRKKDNEYEPAILVMRREKSCRMPKEVREQFETLRYKARDIAAEHYLFCRELIYKEIPDFLKEDEFQIDHACANIFAMRGAVLEEAVEQGYLTLDKANDKKTLGAYLVI